MNTSRPSYPLRNPYKPGAGHPPPHLAGRAIERNIFGELLNQEVVLQNLVITGLRGIGKTVLLNEFASLAIAKGWLWTGTDSSESNSVDEDTLAIRIITDLSLITSNLIVDKVKVETLGFNVEPPKEESIYLDYFNLMSIFQNAPGLISDKLKHTIEFAWVHLSREKVRGIIFAYDEAQTLGDHTDRHQYPLSLLLDTFQYLQRQQIPFMLILTGLPMLMTNLVETRTYSERFFHVLELNHLNERESLEAIEVPLINYPLKFNKETTQLIINKSGGYPYFIQYICRETFDVFAQNVSDTKEPKVPMDAILKKLDVDFFAGRWGKATEKEKEIMLIIANLDKENYKVKDIENAYHDYSEFEQVSRSRISQILQSLVRKGLIL